MNKFFNNEKGITLVEVILSIVIVSFFSAVLITNFPGMKSNASLSRSAYKLAQDLRRVQDMSLSGQTLLGADGKKILISGYGMYLNSSSNQNTKYIIYADKCPQAPYDKKYTQTYASCPTGDQIMETIDLEQGVVIRSFDNGDSSGYTSINFSPPNPTTTISNMLPAYEILNYPIGITLGISGDSSKSKVVYVYPSGLIEVR